MEFLINILFGILAGALTMYLCRRARFDEVLCIVMAVIVGFIVFSFNFAAQVV